ncbi:MAG: hypothetical protein JW820_18665 [Spirochaetales bacterium]|nr:hypothetical protein [Spirochaetales bacterium]
MRTVWFANDTPLTEEAGRLSISAEALGLPAGYWPDQVIVNGYSYSCTSVGGCGSSQLYRRDQGGAELTVCAEEGLI